MVTHDQAEAMTLADRIVVINDRQIQQVGAPMEIYNRPANSFVAQFVGSPSMTLASATLVDGDGDYARLKLGNGSEVATRVLRAGLPAQGLMMGVRPEAVRVVGGGKGATTTARVELVERLGERTGDKTVQVLLRNIAERIPTEAVIFDVSTDRGIRSGNQTITEIMYRLFLRALGYAGDLDLAELEITLEADGRLAAFEERYRAIGG